MMRKTQITIPEIQKVIREAIQQEELQTFYVANSSYFDTHPYRVDQIAIAVNRAGGQNIKTENAYNWSNQPEVVVFEAENYRIENISAELARELKTEWIHIRAKDW